MNAVIATGRGAIEVNWSWLPTWIGMNTSLIKEIEQTLSPQLVGKPLDNETLAIANKLLIDYITEKFKIPGLFDYIDGLKYVNETLLDENRTAKPQD